MVPFDWVDAKADQWAKSVHNIVRWEIKAHPYVVGALGSIGVLALTVVAVRAWSRPLRSVAAPPCPADRRATYRWMLVAAIYLVFCWNAPRATLLLTAEFAAALLVYIAVGRLSEVRQAMVIRAVMAGYALFSTLQASSNP